MKTLLHLSVILILACNCSVTNKLPPPKPALPLNPVDYSIVRIDSIGNYYVLYGSRNDSLYKIISKKEITSHCDRIVAQASYSLLLRSTLSSYARDQYYRKNTLLYCDSYDEESIICFEDGCIRDLFYADNIKGLCFTGNVK